MRRNAPGAFHGGLRESANPSGGGVPVELLVSGAYRRTFRKRNSRAAAYVGRSDHELAEQFAIVTTFHETRCHSQATEMQPLFGQEQMREFIAQGNTVSR